MFRLNKTLTIVVLLIFLFGDIKSYGQYPAFLNKGRIEYERKVNLYSAFDPGSSLLNNYRQIYAQFRTMKFTLDFSEDQSIYYPSSGQIDESIIDGIAGMPAQSNVVFTQFNKLLRVTKKRIFERNYLVEDSVENIHWRLTSERRTIAGFECKRANAILFDSIFVVAFYNENIIPTGGPESFAGLPGMILGLAIPSLHVNWFATKVTPLNEVQFNSLIPLSGIKVNNSKFKSDIKDVFNAKGKFAWMYQINALL